MEIMGNKICCVCMTLNSKVRKQCMKCNNNLTNVIVSGRGITEFRDKRQFKNNNYIFTFSEVN